MYGYNLVCVVLKSRNYKDADKIFTLYSKEKGKVSATAKGVRKIKSRRAGNLDTLNYVKVGIHESPAGFQVITEAKVLDSFEKIKKDLDVSEKAYYVIYLLNRFVEEDYPSTELFTLLLSTLRKLNENPSSTLPAVLRFELGFLKLLGYGVPLSKADATLLKKLFGKDHAILKSDPEFCRISSFVKSFMEKNLGPIPIGGFFV